MSHTRSPKWVKERKVVEHTGLSRETVRRRVNDGTFESFLVGGTRLFDLHQIDDAIRGKK